MESLLALVSGTNWARMQEMKQSAFTALYHKSGRWWIGRVEEVPGANTQGRTLREVRANLKEAVRMVLAAQKEIRRRQEAGTIVRERLAVTIE